MNKIILVLLLILSSTSVSLAQISLTARVGFDGYCQNEECTPILIEVENTAKENIKGEFILSAEESGPFNTIEKVTSSHVFQVDIPANSTSKHWIYFSWMYLFETSKKPEIALLVNKQIVASTPLLAASIGTQKMIIVPQREITSAYHLQKTIKYKLNPQIPEELIFIHIPLSDLPDKWAGYSGVTAILMDRSSLKLLTSKQKEAIDVWSSFQGNLIDIKGQDIDCEKIGKDLMECKGQESMYKALGEFELRREWLSAIPQMRLPSPGTIFVLVCLYILIIGPINYIVLKKKKRSELSLVTIPALVILLSLVFFLYSQFIRGEKVVLNGISVLNVLSGKGSGILTSYYGLFSPGKTKYSVVFHGKTFIAMCGYKEDYKIIYANNETRLKDFPVEKWSMRTFDTSSLIYLDGEISVWRNNQQLYLKNTSNYNLLDSGLLINGTYKSLGKIKGRTEKNWKIDDLKQKTEYSAKEIIGIPNKDREIFFAWLEKPLIRINMSPGRCEKRVKTLVVVPVL